MLILEVPVSRTPEGDPTKYKSLCKESWIKFLRILTVLLGGAGGDQGLAVEG